MLGRRGRWSLRATAIELAPLDGQESEELASALLTERDVPPAQRALVLERAGGNPLYLEEIARALDDASLLERIPDTVQALIAARIDRLGADEKRVCKAPRYRSRLLAKRARSTRAGRRRGCRHRRAARA